MLGSYWLAPTYLEANNTDVYFKNFYRKYNTVGNPTKIAARDNKKYNNCVR
jgi:hypothetical protein